MDSYTFVVCFVIFCGCVVFSVGSCIFFIMLFTIFLCCLSFFFSSRRRHTRCLSDWSSDVCSSDLAGHTRALDALYRLENWKLGRALTLPYFLRSTTRLSRVRNPPFLSAGRSSGSRSEERRVGKECRSRWWP